MDVALRSILRCIAMMHRSQLGVAPVIQSSGHPGAGAQDTNPSGRLVALRPRGGPHPCKRQCVIHTPSQGQDARLSTIDFPVGVAGVTQLQHICLTCIVHAQLRGGSCLSLPSPP